MVIRKRSRRRFGEPSTTGRGWWFDRSSESGVTQTGTSPPSISVRAKRDKQPQAASIVSELLVCVFTVLFCESLVGQKLRRGSAGIAAFLARDRVTAALANSAHARGARSAVEVLVCRPAGEGAALTRSLAIRLPQWVLRSLHLNDLTDFKAVFVRRQGNACCCCAPLSRGARVANRGATVQKPHSSTTGRCLKPDCKYAASLTD